MRSARGGTDAPTRPTPPGGPSPGGPLVPPAPVRGEPHDMRRKRPPALAFLLRMDTLRRLARVASLLALDFSRPVPRDLHRAVHQGLGARRARPRDGPGRADTRPRTSSRSRSSSRALLFARSGLYAGRAQRPGPHAHRRRRSSRRRSSRCSSRSSTALRLPELLHLLRLAVLRRRLRRRCSAARYERVDRRAAAGGRLPAPRGARRHRRAHRGRRARARRDGGDSPVEHRSASSRSRRGPTTACARSARSTTSAESLDDHRVDEVIIADPDFPQERGGRARRPAATSAA